MTRESYMKSKFQGAQIKFYENTTRLIHFHTVSVLQQQSYELQQKQPAKPVTFTKCSLQTMSADSCCKPLRSEKNTGHSDSSSHPQRAT